MGLRVDQAMRAKLAILALVAFALASYAATSVVAGSDKNQVKARLNSFNEVPTVSSTGSGSFEASIDSTNRTITFTLRYRDLEAPAAAAHIHLGARSTAGGVV